MLDRVGNTPLVRMERVGSEYPNAEFYAKAEWFNPGGSVKDRAALNMIREGERSGRVARGQDNSGCDQRQHRNRVRDDRRGAAAIR